jgi:hypothetical protein
MNIGRKHGYKPNLKAQQRNAAKRDDGLDWLADGRLLGPEHERYRREHTLIYRCDVCDQPGELARCDVTGIETWACDACRNPPVFGTRDESGYSHEELIQDKAREDARTIDGEDI